MKEAPLISHPKREARASSSCYCTSCISGLLPKCCSQRLYPHMELESESIVNARQKTSQNSHFLRMDIYTAVAQTRLSASWSPCQVMRTDPAWVPMQVVPMGFLACIRDLNGGSGQRLTGECPRLLCVAATPWVIACSIARCIDPVATSKTRLVYNHSAVPANTLHVAYR